MTRKTLLVDGEWNIRRSFKKRIELFDESGQHCGGVFGFIETLGYVINKVLPDRVIVMWDGDMSGKLRRELYPLYKEGHKDWEEEAYIRTAEELDSQSRLKISLANQKLQTKNFIDSLFIRQAEVEYIEGDDLIAQYVKTKDDDEQIIIYSRDKDYYQLIDENVYVLRPADSIVLTPKNFKPLFGYTLQNCLTLKCIEGDGGDGVPGISGVGYKTVIKYFPKFSEDEYTIDRIISEAADIYSSSKAKKKPKALESIIGSRRLFERNQKLMDLKNPFVNQEAIDEIEIVKHCVLANENGQFDRSINDVIKEFMSKGYSKFIYKRDLAEDINNFFMPYQRISTKEKEYTRKILQS